MAIYDNFPGSSLNGSKWNSGGTNSVSSNKLTLTGGNVGTYVNTSGIYALNPGTTVTWSNANLPTTLESDHYIGMNFLRFQTQYNLSSGTVIYVQDGDGSSHTTGISSSTTSTLHEFKINWQSNGIALYYIDGSLVYTNTVVYSTAQYLLFSIYDTGTSAQTTQVSVALSSNASFLLNMV